MKVFPAVDILHGRCVQLVQGRRESATDFGDPITCAERWVKQGATFLHMVNLDGAFGDSRQNAAIIHRIIRETGVGIQLGGGIRSYEDAASWLEFGADRVILGTSAVREPGLLTRLADQFGNGRVVAGVDARQGMIAIEGWEKTGGDYVSWACRFEEAGAGFLLFTNVDVEGLQKGTALGPVARLIGSVGVPVIVAGGISGRDDVTGLKGVGAYGIVLGSALYSGKLPLSEALEAADENR